MVFLYFYNQWASHSARPWSKSNVMWKSSLINIPYSLPVVIILSLVCDQILIGLTPRGRSYESRCAWSTYDWKRTEYYSTFTLLLNNRTSFMSTNKQATFEFFPLISLYTFILVYCYYLIFLLFILAYSSDGHIVLFTFQIKMLHTKHMRSW